MSFESQQKKQRTSPINEAKSLLSQGDVEQAFSVLKEASGNGDIMACYDCGFMMIQGIGCEKDREEGLEFIYKGVELEEKAKDMNWKSDGSVSDLFEPQSMDLNGWCLFMDVILNINIDNSNSFSPLDYLYL